MEKITVPEFPELTFEEERHVYKLNGIIIPSVTTLMKPLSNDSYGSIDERVLAKAATRGTSVHNAIENYINFGIEDIDPSYADCFASFLQWWELRKPEPIATECRIYHKILRYAGTADLICYIDDKLTLVDYKCTSQVQHKLHAVQLEGYDRALESHGIKVENRMILHLSKTNFEEIQFERSAKSWAVMSALVTLYNYRKEK